MIRTESVTITAKCDGPNCYRSATATGRSAAEATAALRRQDWTVSRARSYCRACANDRARLIRNGVLNKTGDLVTDTAAFDAYLDKRHAAVRL